MSQGVDTNKKLEHLEEQERELLKRQAARRKSPTMRPQLVPYEKEDDGGHVSGSSRSCSPDLPLHNSDSEDDSCFDGSSEGDNDDEPSEFFEVTGENQIAINRTIS
ncbi:hypothetical protein QAD02_012545 [Eretmocerus hayati]|uniref:Uncharacterized protein n=1 Tax=Eretmocerus hayati TaxID=131215 RepID=A0ACC2P0Y6_9HYME|nr:hypothetical protein QAD02_012545 [Eretmocerus hayati]